ncbi:hypothetical protein [Marinobacter nauticus]|uniref:hypothetical protein n=1 Tax=Marinobacter nauticus TaxID=2743 RepID=UPI001C99273A|nr:hypothetical protein [Marinobacter nauticus]MBY5938097.1 hypothetical protein [Marinobacter nauticus]MBY5955326.1 hypothetical protein [Marinobacter nauticus]MBY6009117.1 hypothetical protein [Marinobacter nauticus]
MKAKLSLLLVLSVLITGCGSPNIDAVKDSAFLVDESFSVAQALDERPICADSSWEEYEDDRGRIFVEYRCELRGAGQYFSNSKDSADEYLSKTIGQSKEMMQNTIDEIQARLAEGPELIEKVMTEFEENGELDSFPFVQYVVSPYSDCNVSTSSYSDEKASKLRECLEARIAKFESNNQYRRDELEEMNRKIASKSRVSEIHSATEIFKWTLTEESLYYHGGGISLEFDDQSDLYFPYMEDGGRYGYTMKSALEDTLRDEFQDYSMLADARPWVPTYGKVISEL